MDACTVMKREKRHNASGISNEGMQFLAMRQSVLLNDDLQFEWMLYNCGGGFTRYTAQTWEAVHHSSRVRICQALHRTLKQKSISENMIHCCGGV